MKPNDTAVFIIRIGLGIFFLLFSISKFTQPLNWAGYIPDFISGLLAGIALKQIVFVMLLGLVEAVLGVLLVFGVYTKIIAGIAVALILPIMISQIPNEIAIRDFGLFCMAIALLFAETSSLFSCARLKRT